MDYVWIIIGGLLLLTGIAGAIIPGIPGPAVGFVGLWLAQISDFIMLSSQSLIILLILAIVITLLDYYVPIWGTKKWGGTKAGVWGSTIGLIAGLFILPLLGITLGPFGLIGIILGPFAGAYIGELMVENDKSKALKSAIGSFIGFLAGTFIKLIYTLSLLIYAIVLLF